MSTKQFYLLGESPASSQIIEIPAHADLESLQQLIASNFAIVEAQGIGFVTDGTLVTAVVDVLSSEDPVAISIDGKAVREVPGPKGLPYLGNYLEVYPDHLGNHQRLFDSYGPLIKTTNIGSTIYSTNDPNLANIAFSESDFFTKSIIEGHPLHPIRDRAAGIFLGDTDTEEWRLAHKFLPPALGPSLSDLHSSRRPKAVRHYAPNVQKIVENAFKVFDELDEREEAWNVYPYMIKLGSQAVAKLVLGMDFEHFTSVDAPIHEMVALFAELLELTKKITSVGSWYAKLPFGDPKKLRHVRARMEELMTEAINKAVRGTEDLDLQEAALKAENMIDYVYRAVDSKGNRLPKEMIREPLFVTIGAGFTTTASLLSWLIYGLVHYPGMQERLLQELIDNGIDEKTQMNTDLVSKLTFLDKYVKETQRRHNPSYQPARTAKVDMILPGGYKLPKDSIMIPAIHHIHNNTALWDNPARFDPDRWDTDKVKNRPSGSYIPFATGPRSCIGFNFALMEVKTFLPKLVYRYKFTLAKDGPVDYDPMFALIRPTNLYVRAERRVKWPPCTNA
ncbi:hypothetical protein NPX13_g4405 [Xylaria arbuscula]|uniref:Cytochrome P450 monooxygenase n=1 Tax=Xylaria arbuscula TaxID=114810 RepID=A0A9W8NGL0_9PEZI|nr:hypothetical protein NPX13_g4405 [Xylaria arbuscula]